MARPRLLALSVLGLMACDSTPVTVPKAPPPPPLPALTAAKSSEPAPPEPAREADQRPAREAAPARAEKPAAQKASVKPAKATGSLREPLPTPSADKKPTASAPSAPASQAPQIIATTPKPAAASKVSVPKTVHVAIDVPPGLQADLDRDPRMQPWVNQVVATIDRCYASESKSHATLSGTIEVLVTMHENERPDADIKQLPPALSPIVACATGGLMRTKMPLFTGKEGSRYTVRLRFSP